MGAHPVRIDVPEAHFVSGFLQMSPDATACFVMAHLGGRRADLQETWAKTRALDWTTGHLTRRCTATKGVVQP